MREQTLGKRPSYYLQNFHFQSGGWMTDDLARRYDTQVEVLFNGTANATRRQALVPLHEVFAGRDQRRLRLLDVVCGTGAFWTFSSRPGRAFRPWVDVGGLRCRGEAPSEALVLDQPHGREGGGHSGSE